MKLLYYHCTFTSSNITTLAVIIYNTELFPNSQQCSEFLQSDSFGGSHRIQSVNNNSASSRWKTGLDSSQINPFGCTRYIYVSTRSRRPDGNLNLYIRGARRDWWQCYDLNLGEIFAFYGEEVASVSTRMDIEPSRAYGRARGDRPAITLFIVLVWPSLHYLFRASLDVDKCRWLNRERTIFGTSDFGQGPNFFCYVILRARGDKNVHGYRSSAMSNFSLVSGLVFEYLFRAVVDWLC